MTQAAIKAGLAPAPNTASAEYCKDCFYTRIEAISRAFGGGADIGHYCAITGHPVHLDDKCSKDERH